jgi:DNA-binding NtrC family response regulator
MLAKLIHKMSPRRSSCWSRSTACDPVTHGKRTVGYERGAFTEHYPPSIGLVEAAHKGTVFRRIAELRPEMQIKLLEAIERQFKRVGDRGDYGRCPHNRRHQSKPAGTDS